MDILNELVHLGNSFVIFLQANYLLVEDVMLLVTHLKVLFEAVDIDTQLLVLICKLHVEVLLEVQVTLHVRHLSIPEVELASLLLIVLLHQGHSAIHVPLLAIHLLDLRVK